MPLIYGSPSLAVSKCKADHLIKHRSEQRRGKKDADDDDDSRAGGVRFATADKMETRLVLEQKGS